MQKALLEQVYGQMESNHGIKLDSIPEYSGMLTDKEASTAYIEGLSDGLVDEEKDGFQTLAENTRTHIMESNNSFQFSPYDTLAIPILRDFYPKLVSKELITVTPINKPDVIRYFMRGYFKKNADSTYARKFPYVTSDISKGQTVGVDVTATSARGTSPGVRTDVLAVAGLTSANSHVEKPFKITGVTDSTSNYTTIEILPDVNGYFSKRVDLVGGYDIISGNIDWESGMFTWSSESDEATSLTYEATCSLEENSINPKLKLKMEPIRLTTELRQIQSEWTLPFQQDMKALFELSVQKEAVSIMGDQIALDIDRELLSELIAYNSTSNDSSHNLTFDKNPAATFSNGQKQWYETILPKLGTLSAQIYNDTNIGGGNVIAANPLDAAIFESLNTFEYVGGAVEGGDVGYKSATVQGGKWKILTSSTVTQGTMVMVYKSPDVARSIYMYAPYIPIMTHPYPYGSVPTTSIMSRDAKVIVRPEGIATMTITDTA